MRYAQWCPDCETYVSAVTRHRCFGEYCPDCETPCHLIPDAREPEALLREAVRIIGSVQADEDGVRPDVQDFLDRVQSWEVGR